MQPIRELSKFGNEFNTLDIFSESKSMQSSILKKRPMKVNKVKIKKVSKVKSSLKKQDVFQNRTKQIMAGKDFNIQNDSPLCKSKKKYGTTRVKLNKKYVMDLGGYWSRACSHFQKCSRMSDLRHTILFAIYAFAFAVVFGALRVPPPKCIPNVY